MDRLGNNLVQQHKYEKQLSNEVIEKKNILLICQFTIVFSNKVAVFLVGSLSNHTFGLKIPNYIIFKCLEVVPCSGWTSSVLKYGLRRS